jgi:hypothetical protein
MWGRVTFDFVSFASGVAVATLGAFALLESEGTLDLSFGWAGVFVTAAVGAVFLLSGLTAGDEDRHDCRK